MFSLLIIPRVLAESCNSTLDEEITVSLCQSGCDYSSVIDLVRDTESNERCRYNNVNINIMDNESYDFSNFYSLSHFYIAGKNTDDEHKPSILLGNHFYDILSMQNIAVLTQEDTVVNGLELDNVYVEGVLYLTGSGDMKVNNSYFTNKFMINSSKGKVSINNIFAEKYSYFQGEIYINDSEFNDEVDIYGIGEIKNSRIDSKSLYGLHIRRNINQYCRFVNEVYDQESFLIDNVTIRGASAYGVSYDIVDKAYDKFEIKNSDLSDNFCSFEASVQEITCSDVGAGPKASIIGETYNAKLLESKFNNFSKLSGFLTIKSCITDS